MTGHKDGYRLLCSFEGLFANDPDGRIDAAFVLGVEFGRVTAALAGKAELEVTAHAENQEAFRRWASATGYEVEAGPTTPPTSGWAMVKFRLKPPRSHLRVVTP